MNINKAINKAINKGSYTVVSSEEELSVVIDAYSKVGFDPYKSKESSLDYLRIQDDMAYWIYAVDLDGDGCTCGCINPEESPEDYIKEILLEGDPSYKPNEIKLSELV